MESICSKFPNDFIILSNRVYFNIYKQDLAFINLK